MRCYHALRAVRLFQGSRVSRYKQHLTLLTPTSRSARFGSTTARTRTLCALLCRSAMATRADSTTLSRAAGGAQKLDDTPSPTKHWRRMEGTVIMTTQEQSSIGPKDEANAVHPQVYMGEAEERAHEEQRTSVNMDLDDPLPAAGMAEVQEAAVSAMLAKATREDEAVGPSSEATQRPARRPPAPRRATPAATATSAMTTAAEALPSAIAQGPFLTGRSPLRRCRQDWEFVLCRRRPRESLELSMATPRVVFTKRFELDFEEVRGFAQLWLRSFS